MNRALVLSLVVSACTGEVQPLAGDTLDAGLVADADAGAPVDAGSPVDAGPLEIDLALTDDAGVAGRVPVRADIRGALEPITWELTADGAPVASGTGRHVDAQWDSSAAHDNPLPAPNHALDFGYYFTDGKWGDLEPEVQPYTTTYYAGRTNYFADPNPAWPADFSASMAKAAAANRRIILALDNPSLYDELLDRAAPHWAHVILIEAADEPSWNKAETTAQMTTIRGKLAARGLAERPIGVTYTRTQLLDEDAITATGLDWVGIEAYVDPPGSPSSAMNVAALKSYLMQGKARVPAAKSIVMVMMAYARNGAWTNIATLKELQVPTYELSYADPRVIAINMFSYGRSSGTREHPELKPLHMQIGERVKGVPVGALSNGLHRLELRVSAGPASATAARTLRVQN